MATFDRSKWLQAIVDELSAAGVAGELVEKVRIVFQYAETAIAIHHLMPGGELDDVHVNRVNIKTAPRSPAKTMLVVAGVQKRKPVVTFHTGDGGIGIFHGFLQRWSAGSLEWKPDTPVHAVDPGNDVQSLPSLPGP